MRHLTYTRYQESDRAKILNLVTNVIRKGKTGLKHARFWKSIRIATTEAVILTEIQTTVLRVQNGPGFVEIEGG